MSRKVDITEKLSFEGNPYLVIKGHELEVNADAASVLRVMGIISANDDPGLKEMGVAYDILFPQESKNVIENVIKLDIKDLFVLIPEAVNLIVGNEDNKPGE